MDPSAHSVFARPLQPGGLQLLVHGKVLRGEIPVLCEIREDCGVQEQLCTRREETVAVGIKTAVACEQGAGTADLGDIFFKS